MKQAYPSVGRIVHFVYGDAHIPAIVTDPADGVTVHLTVFPVGEPPFTVVAEMNDAATPGTWHWPEYVP